MKVHDISVCSPCVLYKGFLVILFAAVILCSCAPKESPGPIDSLLSASRAEIGGTCRGEPFSAELELGPAAEPADTRDLTLKYTGGTPAGLCVVCRGGVWELRLGDAVLSRSPEVCSSFAYPASVFGRRYFITSISADEGGTLINVTADDGGSGSVLTDADGIPLHISFSGSAGNDINMTVEKFVISVSPEASE